MEDVNQIESEMKRGTPDHWKMTDLARLMKVPTKYALPWANGILERLWHYTARYHPQGDVGAAPNSHIAAACAWPVSEADQLIDALVESKWLDKDPHHRLVVHDWAEHCDNSVKKLLHRNKLEVFCPDRNGLMTGYGSLDKEFPEGFDVWVASICERWGKIKQRVLGERAIVKIFSAGFSREVFEVNFASWCAYHEKLGWQYAPSLAEWIEDGGYKRKAPPIPRRTTAQNELFSGGGGE